MVDFEIGQFLVTLFYHSLLVTCGIPLLTSFLSAIHCSQFTLHDFHVPPTIEIIVFNT